MGAAHSREPDHWEGLLAPLIGGLVAGFLCKAAAVTLATVAPAE